MVLYSTSIGSKSLSSCWFYINQSVARHVCNRLKYVSVTRSTLYTLFSRIVVNITISCLESNMFIWADQMIPIGLKLYKKGHRLTYCVNKLMILILLPYYMPSFKKLRLTTCIDLTWGECPFTMYALLLTIYALLLHVMCVMWDHPLYIDNTGYNIDKRSCWIEWLRGKLIKVRIFSFSYRRL